MTTTGGSAQESRKAVVEVPGMVHCQVWAAFPQNMKVVRQVDALSPHCPGTGTVRGIGRGMVHPFMSVRIQKRVEGLQGPCSTIRQCLPWPLGHDRRGLHGQPDVGGAALQMSGGSRKSTLSGPQNLPILWSHALNIPITQLEYQIPQ